VTIRIAFVLATLQFMASCHAAATDEENDSSFQVIVKPYGSCAQVAFEQSGRSREQVIDSCHGWSVEQCGTQYFFVGRGVRIDTGTSVDPGGQRMDISARINSELGNDEDELLHLHFLQPICKADEFELPFSGSRIGKGEQGSADRLEGTVAVDADGGATVQIDS
jgi:hypothetical protein